MNIRPPHLCLIALPLLVVACATVPKPLQAEFTVVDPQQVADTGRVGDTIRWGGSVIQTHPERERTCIEVLARELSDTARPRQRDTSTGRFVACRDGFYDPEIFRYGREVTVLGRVTALSERTVGDYAYAMPEVAAEVIYLWPEHRHVDVYPYPATWWGPWQYHHRWGLGYYHHPLPRPRPRP